MFNLRTATVDELRRRFAEIKQIARDGGTVSESEALELHGIVQEKARRDLGDDGDWTP